MWSQRTASLFQWNLCPREISRCTFPSDLHDLDSLVQIRRNAMCLWRHPSWERTVGPLNGRKNKQINKTMKSIESVKGCVQSFFSQTSQRLWALKWVQLVNLNRFCLDGKPNGTVIWSGNINVYPKTDNKRQYGGLPVFYFTSLFFVWFFRFFLPFNFQLYPKVAQNVSFFGRTGRWSHQYQRR